MSDGAGAAARARRGPRFGERLALLGELGTAGPALLIVLTAVQLISDLVPAATAVTTAALVGRVAGAASGAEFALVLAPLAAYAGVVALGHAAEAAAAPLRFAVKSRVEGERRARIARIAATCDTVEALERPAVQELIRLAKADPGNWTERTVADGALSQLSAVIGALGLAASCAVLARFAWWLVPLLAVPALIVRVMQSRQGLDFFRTWRRGVGEGRRAEVWSRMLTGPAEGKEVRVFGFAGIAEKRMIGHLRAMFEPTWAVAQHNLRRQWSRFVLTAVPLGAAYAAAALSAAHGHDSVAVESAVFAAGWSALQSFIGYDARAVLGALPGARAYAELQQALGAAGSERPLPPSPGPGRVPAEPAPHVRFEAVGFRYGGVDRDVLRGVDLEIRPGEVLAVVGLNGAGKSTLIKLLAGLYRPTAGRITADGRDLAESAAEAWRRRIGVVFQDFARYQLPLADNIMLGHAHVPPDREALGAAIEDAGLADVIAGLPAGADTPLSRARRGGVDLSGGQWQQVVLARALYAARVGARLLVLDEPTAHLDVRTESELFERLARRRGEVGIVLITHRLSTVRHADRIALLDGGRITECGSHAQLLARGGDYAAMFAIQAERFAAGYDDVAGEPAEDAGVLR